MPIPVTKEVVGYIARYGGRCRDCADRDGVCPSSGRTVLYREFDAPVMKRK